MISIYTNSFQSESKNTTQIEDYLNNIKNGFWQDHVLKYRAGKQKKELTPAVTVSGYFPEKRRAADMKSHSGFLCIDIDAKENDNIDDVISEICADKFVYACHRSVSGKGLAIYIKIDKKKHLESFLAIEKYLAENYKIICDQSCKDVSRLRYVSYDPDIFINKNSEKWATYIDKKQSQPLNFNPIYTNSDIDFVFDNIRQSRIDLTNSYDNWLKCGFALISEFGEGGRSYFHELSKNHPEYDSGKTDKKYTNLLKTGSSKYHISTIFWLAKNAGLKIKTEKTSKIQRIATVRKKEIGKSGGAKDINTAIENTYKYLNEVEGISVKESEKIVNTIMTSNIDENIETSDLEMISEYVKNQNIKYNEITQRYEVDGIDLTDRLENSIFLNAKGLFPKAKISKELISNIINSDRIPTFNPFTDFIKKYNHIKPTGLIDQVLDCFMVAASDLKYAKICGNLIKKWLFAIISTMHGIHNVTILVLIGSQGCNKTNFFRYLLPPQLQRYYAESKLDREKDDELLMCQKLILVDDEFAGKSKKEAGRIKELSSKETITARRSYGKYNEDFKRIAILGGTTNEYDIINDTSGNRRIIPVKVESIDIEKFKKIDKIHLFMELYHFWLEKNDPSWGFLTSDDINQLNEVSIQFTEITVEEEIVRSCFRLPEKNEIGEFYSATEMMTICETYLSKQKLYHKTFGKILRKLGYERIQKKGLGYGFYAFRIK